MTAGTYNDTLTFKAQNGYATGTVLEIEGMKFIVMSQTDDDTYLVIDGGSLGKIQYQPNVDSDGNYKVGIDEMPDVKRSDGQYSNTYKGSYIDNYLENTWYKQLPDKIKNAMQSINISQTTYKDYSKSDEWKDDSNGKLYYNERTSNNPKWVYFTEAIFPDNGQGLFPYNCWKQSDKNYDSQAYDTILRHVFLPSIRELSSLLDLNNANKIYNFSNGLNDSLYHVWSRDSYTNSPYSTIYLDYNVRSMANSMVTNPRIGVRPAFVIDLSKVNATVVDTVHYK